MDEWARLKPRSKTIGTNLWRKRGKLVGLDIHLLIMGIYVMWFSGCLKVNTKPHPHIGTDVIHCYEIGFEVPDFYHFKGFVKTLLKINLCSLLNISVKFPLVENTAQDMVVVDEPIDAELASLKDLG